MMDWISAGWEQANIGFLCMEINGVITAVNPQSEVLFSTSKDDILGKSIFDFVDPYSRLKTQTMLDMTIEEDGVSDWELDIMVANSIPILIGFTTSCIKDESGEIVGIMAVCRDLTEKTALTAQLATANQQLEGALLKLEQAHQDLKNAQVQLIHSEKMRSLGQMVAGVAHEINNPIGFVSNNLVFLQEKTEQLKKHCHQLMEKIPSNQSLPSYFWTDIEDAITESLEGAARVANIVKALRNFSRLDESNFKKANLIDGLKSTLQIVKATHKQRIVFVEEFQPIPEIFCNPGTLNQVFMNLIGNAADAIQDHGQVTIRTSEMGNKVLIEIEDNGSGMDEKTLEHLGEPFFTTKPVGSGTGLGLAISYGIIQNHQGEIEFESELGQGTLVRVSIPNDLTELFP